MSINIKGNKIKDKQAAAKQLSQADDLESERQAALKLWTERDDARRAIAGYGRNDVVMDMQTGEKVKLKKSSQYKLAKSVIRFDGKIIP